MIQTFACPDTKAFFEGARVPNFVNIAVPLARKLNMLNAANMLYDLKVPPNNRLEALSGDRQGQHSIRINDQWRICFTWTGAGPEDVEVVDYH
ncbi:MAG: type II toxin-antitoxin system RelE/ParE family toxin [Telluria sp.]